MEPIITLLLVLIVLALPFILSIIAICKVSSIRQEQRACNDNLIALQKELYKLLAERKKQQAQDQQQALTASSQLTTTPASVQQVPVSSQADELSVTEVAAVTELAVTKITKVAEVTESAKIVQVNFAGEAAIAEKFPLTAPQPCATTACASQQTMHITQDNPSLISETTAATTTAIETAASEIPIAATALPETPIAETPITEIPITETPITKTPVSPPPISKAPIAEPTIINKPLATAAEISQQDAEEAEKWSVYSHFFSWLWRGNPLAKIGILLLFIGVGFLLKFSIGHNLISPAVRLAFTIAGCVALFSIGWLLRHKKRLYALILQGGAIGCLYMTIFGGFKFYALFPVAVAFAAMVLICLLSILLAVLQKTISLALLASTGGYLAPLIIYSDSGNYIFLFAYYLLLSAAILIISVWQAWRPLNLVGMYFTYPVALFWGYYHYQGDYYGYCQFFVVGNLLIFSLLGQLFARKHQQQNQQMIVDYSLLLMPPLVTMAIQYVITQPFYLGSSFSALGLGLFYLLSGYAIKKHYRQVSDDLALHYLLTGITFVALAVPFAFSYGWTAIIWSMIGLLLLTLGCKQQQIKLLVQGSLLLLISSASFLLSDWSAGNIVMAPFLLFSCFAASGLCRYYYRQNKNMIIAAYVFFALALAVWLRWLPAIGDLLAWRDEAKQVILIGLVIVTVWLWCLLFMRTGWQILLYCCSVLWLMGFYYLLDDSLQSIAPLTTGWYALIWLILLANIILFIRTTSARLAQHIQLVMHIASYWLVMAFIATELTQYIKLLPLVWKSIIDIAVLCAVIFGLYGWQKYHLPPMMKWAKLYWYQSLPVLVMLVLLSFSANWQSPLVMHGYYIPLLNALDCAGIVSILATGFASKGFSQLISNETQQTEADADHQQICNLLKNSQLVLLILWANNILIRGLAYYTQVPWSFSAIIDSRTIQATLSIGWGLCALIVMIFSHRQQSRKLWFYGAAIFACVFSKLLLIELFHYHDSLTKALSFIVVALLTLIVGYFAPLPPKKPISATAAASKADKQEKTTPES